MSKRDASADREATSTPRRLRVRDLGPGLLLAATGVGVGDLVSATIAGADHGMTLLWAVAVGVLLKFTITEGVARWQLATGTTLMEGWRDRLPPIVLLLFFVYFLIWTWVVSSALVAAAAMVPAALMPAIPQPAWGLLHALVALAMAWWGTYERLVRVMKVFIGLMVGSVVTTNLLILASGPDWSRFTTAAPFSLSSSLSIIGGVGGTVTMLSYAYWIREQGWSGPARLGDVRTDLAVSFSLVFTFSLCMMFLATQIDWQGRVLHEGPGLALLLASRIAAETGEVGRAIFLLGFWGAATSSLIGVWNGVPYLFDDWLHLRRRRASGGQQGRPYRAYAVYMTLAALSTVFLQRPVMLIFVYTVVGAVFFPFVITTLLWMNNQPTWVTPALRNRAAVNVVLVCGLVLYAGLAVLSL